MDFVSAEVLESNESLRKLFIGGLSDKTTDDSLKEYFSQFGELVDCIVIRDSITKESRKFGFVTYSDMEAADKCIAHVNQADHIVDTKSVEVKRAIPRDLADYSTQKTKKVFIGGIPRDVTEAKIKQLFDECPLNVQVANVSLIKDRETDQSKGFGFVTFEDEDHVAKVVIVHYFNIGQRKVEVRCAEPKEGGGGGGGMRGGRGGRGGMRGSSRGGGRGGGNYGNYGGGRGGGGGNWHQGGYDGAYDQQYNGNGYGGGNSYQNYNSGYQNDQGFGQYGGSGGGGGYWDQSQAASGYAASDDSSTNTKGGGYGGGNYSQGGGGYGGGRGGGGPGRGQNRYRPY
ncbi:RNA-binding protein Musashi homolog 2-like isoform X2 [Tubulanus polymorphus]|uniref:RNA-binding protein Musashi homolog 2-like isoform X2 n=1 Tax=Tubulanus polymorphus TaxID=672921 RepID=UPI003DA447D8